MQTSLLRQPRPETLSNAQQTYQYLQGTSSSGTTTIAIPFVSVAESAELWTTYEKQLFSCLQTGDDKAAHLCLERLIDRFGATNERVMGLRGLYQEVVARDEFTLERVLQEYDEAIAEDPVNAPIVKRRVALLQTLSRRSDAIDALTELLESSPTDIEAWVELSALYFQEGLYSQAVFCLEEVLLIAPNAWNIHARLGEILYMACTASDLLNSRDIVEALRRFCRSIELCDEYLRGYYGLKITTDKLLLILGNDWKKTKALNNDGNPPLPSIEVIQKLNSLSTSKLARMAQNSTGKKYEHAEVVATRALLDKNTLKVQR